jgi:hypothetical protein
MESPFTHERSAADQCGVPPIEVREQQTVANGLVGSLLPHQGVPAWGQPPMQPQHVLPVEWFRRMPGGSTTYAPDLNMSTDPDSHESC